MDLGNGIWRRAACCLAAAGLVLLLAGVVALILVIVSLLMWVPVVEIIGALKRSDSTQHIRAVLFGGGDSDEQEALEAGASAHVNTSDVRGLKDTLEALMGVGR